MSRIADVVNALQSEVLRLRGLSDDLTQRLSAAVAERDSTALALGTTEKQLQAALDAGHQLQASVTLLKAQVADLTVQVPDADDLAALQAADVMLAV